MARLVEQLDQVNSRESFITFAEKLRQDLIANPADWENDRLESFLEAIEAWTSDAVGYYRNRGESLPTEPSWRQRQLSTNWPDRIVVVSPEDDFQNKLPWPRLHSFIFTITPTTPSSTAPAKSIS